ncbi:MAG: hypothetical protein KAT25_02685 [Sulfuriflexus sp.]|nr:hypothetical protein [Sulfuriflexus sp.]
MSEIVDLTGLAIPAQQSADKTSFDVRPKFMEKWITSLPMANLGETSRLVFKAVVEINRLDMPVQQRYKAMELLRKPCHYIVESLEKHFAGRPLPLNKRNRKISELARALLSELAVGYKIIARQTETSSRPDLKLLTSALHRAMSYQGLLLLRSYQVYAPYPRGIWKELHTIYHFIESYDLLNQVIKDPLNLLPGNSSIDTLYKKILLLSLSMPYRLHRGEIDKVCTLLNQFVSFTRLDKITEGSPPAGLFIIDLDSDNQPGYLAMHNSNDYRSCRLLNTSEMIININEQLQSSDSELLKIASDDLVMRLLAAWSILSKRSFSRIQRDESFANVAFGLSAAHHFVSGEQVFSPVPEEAGQQPDVNGKISDFHSTRVHAISDIVKGPDVWNMNYTYSENDPSKTAPDKASLANNTAAQQGFEYETIQLGMANISAGGYCLVSQGDINFSAHVGDLLAVRDTDDIAIGQWGIGVVRRMLSNRSGSIELGIEMLTPNAVAVAARLEGEKNSQTGSDYLRCLMLPELRTIEQPATIITPAMPFKPDSRIRINLQDRSIIAVLSKQLECTRSFSQFEFKVLEEDAPRQTNMSNTVGSTINEDDFDSIWSSL